MAVLHRFYGIILYYVTVQCPDLQDPASGIVSISNTGTVSSAIYSCVEGYQLSGSTIRQCLTTGSWEFTEPTCCKLYRGSYMSAHVLLNLLNEFGKIDKMRGWPRILSLFHNEFNKFNNTGARM